MYLEHKLLNVGVHYTYRHTQRFNWKKGWCPMSIIESHDISPSAGAWQSTMRVCISSPIVCMITEIE